MLSCVSLSKKKNKGRLRRNAERPGFELGVDEPRAKRPRLRCCSILYYTRVHITEEHTVEIKTHDTRKDLRMCSLVFYYSNHFSGFFADHDSAFGSGSKTRGLSRVGS